MIVKTFTLPHYLIEKRDDGKFFIKYSHKAQYSEFHTYSVFRKNNRSLEIFDSSKEAEEWLEKNVDGIENSICTEHGFGENDITID